MDSAALIISSDLAIDVLFSISGAAPKQKGKHLPPVSLGTEKGLCGSGENLASAGKVATGADTHFNAPASIHVAAQMSATFFVDNGFVFSDKRDMTVDSFEILHRNLHLTPDVMVTKTLRR